jgi:hypothetical protein
MGLRLKDQVDIRLSPSEGPWLIGNGLKDKIALDYHDLALLSWISCKGSAAPLVLGSPGGPGFYKPRIHRLLQAEILECDPIREDASPIELDRWMWPAFIVGSYRSGTTLLRYILDAHPSLACPPESKFIPGLQGALDFAEARAGLNSIGVVGEDVLFDLRRLIEMVLGGCAARNGKRRWVEKTPNYFRHVSFIDNVFGGEVLYLVTVRHPLDCVDSLGTFFEYEGANYADPEVARKVAVHGKGRHGWARFWVEVYSILGSVLTSLADRTWLIKYEDLVTKPEQTMKALLGFMGEELPPSLLSDAFKMSHAIGAQDDNITRTNQIHKGSLDRWRTWPASEIRAVWDIVGPTAAKFGYGVPI